MNKFILGKPVMAIEGGDGSGKATQAALLKEYLEKEYGLNIKMLDFPRYNKPSGMFAEHYLNGNYGTKGSDVHPELASLPYSIDRFAAIDEISEEEALIIDAFVCNRYTGSNLAHQGGKIKDAQERFEFYERIQILEFDIFKIPRPDLNIVLLVDTEVAQFNIDQKGDRIYTDKKRDIHEADADHLDMAKFCYQELCELFPNLYTAIGCMENGKMRSKKDIHEEIVSLVIDKLNIL